MLPPSNEANDVHVPFSCRSSLSPAAPPSEGAAGASLAAAFLEQGLATSDTAVLGRLMSLLTARLGDAGAAQAAAYAEWVAVRATVALLEAHAHCAVFAGATADSAARQCVVKAQAPHQR